MKKKFILFTFMILALGTLTGCGSSSNYGGQPNIGTSTIIYKNLTQNTETKSSSADIVDKKDVTNPTETETETETKSTSTISKDDNSNFDIGTNKAFIKGLRRIQLIGTGNIDELPFNVKYIELQAGGVTVFTLENDTKRIVNCSYKEIY